MWTIFNVFTEFVITLLLFYFFFFFFFVHKVCRILVPRPGIELALPALEGEILTSGPLGKSLHCFLKLVPLTIFYPLSRWPFLPFYVIPGFEKECLLVLY